MKEIVVALITFVFACQVQEDRGGMVNSINFSINGPEDLKDFLSIVKREEKNGMFSYKIRFDAKMASRRDQERTSYGRLEIRSEGERLSVVRSDPRKKGNDFRYEFWLKPSLAKESVFRIYSIGIDDMGIEELGKPFCYVVRLERF